MQTRAKSQARNQGQARVQAVRRGRHVYQGENQETGVVHVADCLGPVVLAADCLHRLVAQSASRGGIR